jgi:hypothetical protein
MADGISSLNSISWGTSTGGSAVSAESTLTLGVDRADTRIPPDTSHLWGAALNNAKNLLLAMSATFKSGTRLGVATQSSSPFAANEQGLWVDNSGNLKFAYGGVSNTLFSVALGTKGDLITYTGAAVAVQGTGGAGNNGFVLTADSTQANGIKWAAGGVTWPLANGTSTDTFNYAGTFGGTSTAYSFSSTNAPSGLGDDFFTWAPSGTKRGSVKYNPGTDNFQIVSPSAFVDFFDNNSSGLRIQNGVSTQLLSAGVAVVTSTQTAVVGSGSNTLGTAATTWTETYSKRYATLTQAVAASTNLTIGTVNGDHIRLSLSATAISTLTVNAGLAGEVLRVEVIQDATGSRTIPTTWTNVVFAGGTYTATTTANKRDILTLVYDATAAKWYESARSMNL